MLKRLQRLSKTKAAVRVTIELKAVKFGSQDENSGSMLCIVYEKQGKLKSSSFKKVDKCGHTPTASFNERLEISATLYKDSNGSFMSKTCELHIRRKEDTLEFSTKSIGTVVINLHELLEGVVTQLRLPVEKLGVSINATLEAVVVINTSDDNIGDDAVSVISDSTYYKEQVIF